MAAERLDAAGQIAGWFAHQINNPLGAISGNAQLLARRLQRDIGDREALEGYLRYLESIQSQVERCARITGEVLNFTRPGGPDLRSLSIQAVLDEARELIGYAYPESRVEVRFGTDQGLSRVRADREWLGRVFFEVLANAVQASDGDLVCVDVEIASGFAEVRVSDRGPGIPDEVMPRVFDPFFSTRDEARGLGLTIGLDLIRKMNGDLIIRNSEEGGAVATIRVPLWK